MILLLALLGWHEFDGLARKLKGQIPVKVMSLWLVLYFTAFWFSNTKGTVLLTAFAFTWFMLRMVFRYGRLKPSDSALGCFGLLYVTIGFSAMLAIREGMVGSYLTAAFSEPQLQPGRFLFFLLIFSTWASDTFAFFVGKAKGKTKLCPAISPGKTREGALGGFIGTVAVALFCAAIGHFSLLHGFVIGLIIAVMAPLGDLAESILKRSAAVKDSGSLIPGHGGVLDRFDSLLLAAPAVYAYLILIA